MEVNIELAKRLLKEQYFINGDNKIRTQHPIRVEDLAFIMQKYTDEQLTIHSVVKQSELLCDCAMPDPINPWDSVDKDTCRKCENKIA